MAGETSIKHGTKTHFVALNWGLVAVTTTALVGARAGVGHDQAPARVPSMPTLGVLKWGRVSTRSMRLEAGLHTRMRAEIEEHDPDSQARGRDLLFRA